MRRDTLLRSIRDRHSPSSGQRSPGRSNCPWQWVSLRWSTPHIGPMCARVIQSSAPISYAILDGVNVRDSRVHNFPPRWNGAPSQDLLVIRRNHKTGGGSSRIGARTPRVAGNRSTPNARPSGLYLLSGRLIVNDAASCRSTASSNGRRSRARKLSSPMRSP
jgi:hypothetical protein